MTSSVQIALLSFTIIFMVLPVLSEEPFCNNKCNGIGVSTSSPCYCDSACSTVFNDCCGDSEHLAASFGGLIPNKRRLMTCETFGRDSILIVNQCPENWNGPETLRESCEKNNMPGNDPLSDIPVSSPQTGVTYKNYYCSACNGEQQKSVFWKVKVACPTLHPNFLLDSEDIFNYMNYNEPTNEWGFTTRDGKGFETFHSCELRLAIPKRLLDMVRRCDSLEVNTCAISWKRDVIKRMCERYSDPVYSNGIRYKNFYCAICNNEDQSGFTCGAAMGPRHDPAVDPPAVEGPNFALLLDINVSIGSSVGKNKFPMDCESKEEVYDPFKKRCRNVVCGLPGYKLVEGRCTRGI